MAKMRIDSKILLKLQEIFGDYQVGSEKNGRLYFRFGYWQHIDINLIKDLFPAYLSIEEFIVDEDDDTGIAYIYYVWDDRNNKKQWNKKKERDYKLFAWSIIGLVVSILYILLDKYIF
jgi:hypothetical protein